jgi:hypothetical protein
MIDLRVCVICGKSYVIGRLPTCSEECHRKLVEKLIKGFGEYKKVIDAETGKAYKVPVRDIIEKGLKYKDLINYPPWEASES